MSYQPSKIEPKWQKFWAKNNYKNWHTSDKPKKKHIYILDMFPYPSGEGLHVGHVEGYTASDILSRYYRMKGLEVLHPMGWDAFGLPAENYAIQTKRNPKEVVKKNIKRFRKQLQEMGFSYDWQREVDTTDPNYYKWTQWIFLQLYKKGLAYEAEVPVNWCPSCKTVLADEEVVEGKCDRCGKEVTRKNLKQWVLRITAMADRLLEDLDLLDWPARVKTMQKNWIGRSEGYDVEFKIVGQDEYLKTFTTRIDTIFGVTYLILAPEHPLLEKITEDSQRNEVQDYIKQALQKSDFERQSVNKEKTGVFTGAYVINPANRERVPVWVSDYALISYGTGAVMGVPAHDERDLAFAQQFYLPVKEVVAANGTLINSGPFDGMPYKRAQEKIALYVGGTKTVRYKLRDWVFSRQRYWGEPIPIIKCEKCGLVPLKESQLPLKLPEIKKYEPSGKNESPLADIVSWVNVKCPKCKGPAKRETNTMPQWAGSCWYYLRFVDPKNKKKLIDIKKEKSWLPVDIYIGGVEHAVLHLLYARFWHKFLYDIGVVSTIEPFSRLVNQGIILGEDGEKMSKSRGNVISPDSVIKKYGADSLRMYEMFMGPLTFAKPWNTQGVIGIYRFLNRVWSLINEEKDKSKKIKEKDVFKMTPEAKKKLKENIEELEKIRHQTIKKVTEDIESMHFNTAISSLMEYVNSLYQVPKEKINKKHQETLVLLLSPFAPHLAEELWQGALKHRKSVGQEKWPIYKAEIAEEKSFTLVVQVNSKVRDKILVSKGIKESEAKKIAKNSPQVKKYLKKQKIKKVVFVKDRLINFVI
ncbi:MAG: leucine--tRNA ligase [Candidatus Pacebacteria bacterium]|nr:leucine--tRNA ligase [Candidatus Paceibacterota bacterium]MDD5721938.1 leucine--tRNA ligase [Candidatus Paceibacterota bacterium]